MLVPTELHVGLLKGQRSEQQLQVVLFLNGWRKVAFTVSVFIWTLCFLISDFWCTLVVMFSSSKYKSHVQLTFVYGGVHLHLQLRRQTDCGQTGAHSTLTLDRTYGLDVERQSVDHWVDMFHSWCWILRLALYNRLLFIYWINSKSNKMSCICSKSYYYYFCSIPDSFKGHFTWSWLSWSLGCRTLQLFRDSLH